VLAFLCCVDVGNLVDDGHFTSEGGAAWVYIPVEILDNSLVIV
jgi:hypothetical protein